MRVDSMERKIAVMLDYNDAVATIMNNNTPTLHSTVMTDTIRYDKSRILPTRADSLLRQAMEAEHGCADVLMLVASMRGAINGLTAELMEDHIRHHVVNPDAEPDAERARGAAELIEVVRTYLK